jgi:hypothetical protein
MLGSSPEASETLLCVLAGADGLLPGFHVVLLEMIIASSLRQRGVRLYETQHGKGPCCLWPSTSVLSASHYRHCSSPNTFLSKRLTYKTKSELPGCAVRPLA